MGIYRRVWGLNEYLMLGKGASWRLSRPDRPWPSRGGREREKRESS